MPTNKQRILKTVKKFKNSALNYSKSHYVLGSGKILIFDFLTFFWEGLRNQSIGIRASALAFKLFLSLFPALIFFVTLLPYFSSAGFQEAFLQTLSSILPEYTYMALESTLKDFLYNPKFGLLSIVFVLSLFYSVTNMNGILNTFNKSHHLNDNRKLRKKLLISLSLTLMFFTIILIALAFISFNKTLVDWLDRENLFGSWMYITLLQYGRWVILFFIMLTWLDVFYYIAPPVKVKFRYFNPGSLFSSLFFLFISLGFNFFVNHFTNYNKIYGVLGVILVFFIWLYYNAIVILIGFEINASLYIAPNRKPQIDKSIL